MIGHAASPLSIAELEAILKAVDPSISLLPPRLLRCVIKQDRGLTGFGLQVPHRKSYVIRREALLAVVDKDELELALEGDLPPTVILLARPSSEKLASLDRAAALLSYWRLLLHARVHVLLEERPLDEASLRERIQRIGPTAFAEIRRVLEQERYLLPPGDDHTVYVEFAALYLELRYFAPTLLPCYFPAVGHFDRIDQLLADDLDADKLLAATRPEGARDPVIRTEGPVGDDEDEPPAPEPSVSEEPSFGQYRRLRRRAKKAAAVGNIVRAALCYLRAANLAEPTRVAESQAAARAELGRLVQRLQLALHFEEKDCTAWRRALAPLLQPAAQGTWPVEARLLYDLQKVCVDHERDLYAVDLVEWAVSFGKQPIKRPVPCEREVLLVKHLRSAASRLRSVRLADADRQRLAALLEPAVHHSEERLRARLRPLLQNALEEVGLRPVNLPERVAQNKLIEELLDRAVERGFLNLGDLRDAVSGNQLKLPDLGGVGEFLMGDRILRANRRLAVVLDGVYRRGEIYLRSLQRLSSLAFGTGIGRFLIRYLALPFGGAYALLVFIEEILHFAGIHWHLPATEMGVLVGVLGVFLLLLLYVPPFRAGVVRCLKACWQGLRAVFIDLPAWLQRQPLVRRVLDSRPVVLFGWYLLRPLLATGLAAAGCWLGGASTDTMRLVSGGTFLAAGVLFNSRLGRLTEEAVTDWLVRNWYWLKADILPGLVRYTLNFFKRCMAALERVLYTVDEWLRFKSGESHRSLAAKAVLGLAWFLLTYLIRVVLNLFVEPTINPIKHFPAVTVAAKLLLPLFPVLRPIVTGPLMPMVGHAVAELIFGAAFLLLPGLAGFLVWELKENWKLYAATRSRTLRPVVIGHHGETLLRLLRPGFHSGTLPKLFAKLCQAERRRLRTGQGRAAGKQREALHQVEEAIRHFVEREFVYLLNSSKGWGTPRISTGEIGLATNCIRIEFCCPELGPASLAVAFEEQDGQLSARVVAPGWLPYLLPKQGQVLTTALAGLYKMAGIDFVCDPPAGQVVFRDVSITWQDWVETWERDQEGKEIAGPLLDVARLLPNP